MNILLIGTGGREHALAWACAKDDKVATVFVASGNAGTATEAKCTNTDLNTADHNAVIDFCHKHNIAFVLVGNEAPLVAGIVDDLQAANIKVWGPSKYCAKLEGSKQFAKEFMLKHGIPTAKYQAFDNADQAKAYLKDKPIPIVIKADGLAAGKGVVVATSKEEAFCAIDDMLSANKFGAAGATVVIEDFLHGEEASFICMVDGDNILPMATSQDHKRIGEGDTGANTGGMGAYSPAPVVTDAVHQAVIDTIIYPTVQAMKQNGTPYTGFLYAGLMIDNGKPSVVEFNCRFGDPETQPVMMRLKSSLTELILQGLDGKLPANALWDDRPAIGVVLSSRGYPQSASSGDAITLPTPKDTIKIFHAGTKQDGDTLITNGGRVLCVTALGDDLAHAKADALAVCDDIAFDGKYYRRDIGWRAI